MISNKFNYTTIDKKSVDGRRLYDCPDGNSVASVTTILDKTKDKSQLIAWRKRVGEKKAQEIVTEAASVGTRMHKFLEDYVETDEWPKAGSNPYSQQANKMATVIKEQALSHVDEIWGSEIQLYHPKIYAGTTDLVGVFKGQECIMDFKQSNKPKQRQWIEDYFLQLGAYAMAHNTVYETQITQGVVLMCTPDNYFQKFQVKGKEFISYQHKFLEKVDLYYKRLKLIK